MMNKVIIVVGDATETVDTLYPFYRVREEGFEAVVAGPIKQRYNMVMHEVKPGWTITREWEGYTIEATAFLKHMVRAIVGACAAVGEGLLVSKAPSPSRSHS